MILLHHHVLVCVCLCLCACVFSLIKLLVGGISTNIPKPTKVLV